MAAPSLRFVALALVALAVVALLVYVFSGAYRVPLRTELVDAIAHPWVRGSVLLEAGAEPASFAKKLRGTSPPKKKLFSFLVSPLSYRVIWYLVDRHNVELRLHVCLLLTILETVWFQDHSPIVEDGKDTSWHSHQELHLVDQVTSRCIACPLDR